ncbi:MAG: sodium:calcium antiporter [Clostridiales bacterium]|nr:sodium:calcium antiporter [Clostridiales bacterium]
MDIFLAILILIGSFILILIGGNKLVDSAVAIAHKFNIPTAVIGATLVSIGTTIPEILVTIFSVSSEAGDIAIGNSLGTVIFNACMLGGILFCFSKIKLRKGWHIDYVILITSATLLFLLSFDKRLSIGASLAMLLIFVLFIIINFLEARKHPVQSDDQPPKHSVWIYLLMFVLSAAAVGAGAYFLVQKATYLAELAGLSDIFIGLTIIAFGTSMPELITTINAIRKKKPRLVIGNLVGANILNLTLIIGLVGILTGGTTAISNATLYVTMPFAIIATLVMLLPPIIKNRSYKWQGFVLLALFVIYYTYLILNAIGILVI